MQRHVPDLQVSILVSSFACSGKGACLNSRMVSEKDVVIFFQLCKASFHDHHLELMPFPLSMPASTGPIWVTTACSTPSNEQLSSLSFVMFRTCDTSLIRPQLQGGKRCHYYRGQGVHTCVGVSSWCSPSRAAAPGILAHKMASSSVGSSRAGRPTETGAL